MSAPLATPEQTAATSPAADFARAAKHAHVSALLALAADDPDGIASNMRDWHRFRAELLKQGDALDRHLVEHLRDARKGQ